MYGMRYSPVGFIFLIAAFVIVPIVRGLATGDMPGTSSHRALPLPILIGVGVAVVAVLSAVFARGETPDSADNLPPPPGGRKLAALAESLGLWVEEDPQHKTPRLTGKRNHIWFSATLLRKSTQIVARHGLSLPPGLRISRPPLGTNLPANRERFGNTILDNALLLEGATEANISWADPRLTTALMTVLHPFPGATLDHKTITLDATGLQPDKLAEYLDAIVSLITILQNPPRPALSPPRFPNT